MMRFGKAGITNILANDYENTPQLPPPHNSSVILHTTAQILAMNNLRKLAQQIHLLYKHK